MSGRRFPALMRGTTIRPRSRVSRRPRRAMRSAFAGRRLRRDRFAVRNLRTGGLLGIERKFLDTSKGSTALTAPTDAAGGEFNPTSGCLSAPAQGDGPTNRDGNKIVVQSCLVQGVIQVLAQADQGSADTSANVLIALVQDTQTNGAQLDSESVFTNPSASGILATSPNRNMSFTQRFKVLKMKRIQLRVPSLTFDGTNIEQSGFHTPFKLSWKGMMPVTFTTGSTTEDIANVTNNSLQIVAYCSSTTLGPTLLYNSRVRFVG